MSIDITQKISSHPASSQGSKSPPLCPLNLFIKGCQVWHWPFIATVKKLREKQGLELKIWLWLGKGSGDLKQREPFGALRGLTWPGRRQRVQSRQEQGVLSDSAEHNSLFLKYKELEADYFCMSTSLIYYWRKIKLVFNLHYGASVFESTLLSGLVLKTLTGMPWRVLLNG